MESSYFFNKYIVKNIDIINAINEELLVAVEFI